MNKKSQIDMKSKSTTQPINRVRLLRLSFLFFIGIMFPAFALADWYNTDWQYRKKITIDNTKVSGTSDLTNFPILINGTDLDWRHTGSGGNVGQTDGGDILFTSSDGTTRLDHEIEKYTSTNGEIIAWVRIPTLSYNSDTDIYMYYGNASVADQWNIAGTWDTGLKGVWHLNEDPSGTAPQMKDATSNNNDGTSNGSMTSGDQVDAKIGKGIEIDGSNDWINVPNASSINLTGTAFTLSAWVKSTVNQNDDTGIIIKGTNLYEIHLGVQGSDVGNTRVYTNSSAYLSGPTVLSQDTWYYLVGIYNGSTLKLYLNANEDASTNKSGNIRSTASNALVIGRRAIGDNRFFQGVIDEARIANVARSTDWITTEYNNQNSPSTFYSVGSEDTYPSISSISSTKADGSYMVGVLVPITMTFNEAVTVTGTPQITLETGSSDAVVNYSSGSGTSTLTFDYTVASGHTSSDLDYLPETSGSVSVRVSSSSDDAEERISNGNMDLTSSDLELITDGSRDQEVGMRFQNITIPQGATITNGYIQFTADETNSGQTDLRFYGEDADNTSTFTSTSGNITSRTKTTASVDWNSIPSWTSVGDAGTDQQTPNLSSIIQEIVGRAGWSSGNSMVVIVDGTGERTAESYNGVPGSAPLLAANHSSYALVLNGGTIKDANGNDATLTIPSPGASGSLGANKALIIDATPPTVSSVSSTQANGAYKAGVVIPITVTFSEAVDVVTTGGTPAITLETGASDVVVNYASGSGTSILTFNYTVASGHTSSDLDYLATTSLALNGGTIKDAVGNDATLTLPSPGAANSLGANKDLVIDTTPPVLSSTSPVQSTTVKTTQVSYTLSETVASGSVTWTRTGGTADGNSPHSQSLTGGELNSGVHTSITLTNNPTLIDGAIYTIAFDATDAAGNVATTVSNTNVTYDVATEVPILTSPASSSSDNATLATDFTLPEAASNGTVKMTFTRTAGSTDANSPHVITFVAGFGTAAQHTTTLNGDDLSNNDDVFSVSSQPNDAFVDGAVYDVKFEYQDAVGNAMVSVTNTGFIYDTTSPTVSSVLSTKADGSYKAGELIPITVSFSEVVTVSGTPQITLETGSSDAVVNYTSGSGTAILTFNYTVTSEQNSSDLDYVANTSLVLNGGTVKDAAMNNATLMLPDPGTTNSLAANKALIIDTTNPTVTISSTLTSPTSTSPIPIAVAFNENVTGFVGSDVTVVNGDIASESFSGSGSSYSFTVIPSGDGAVTVAIAANVAQDEVGNGNTAASNFSINYDTSIPTVTVTSSAGSSGSYTNTSPIPITVTFSEIVTGFVVSEVTAENGTVSSFSGSGTTYTFDVTPSGDGVTVTVDVAANVAQDAAGTNNTVASQFSITYDATAPTVTIASSAGSSGSSTQISPISMTATFSESVSEFSAGDVTIIGGSITSGSFSGSGSSYSFTVTPSGDGTVTIAIASSVAQDVAGNGNTAATQFNIVYDTTVPTVVITSSAGSSDSFTNTSPIPVTVTFSESVSGFSSTDVTVGNGSITSDSFSGSGSSYSFTVTPSGDGVVVAVDVEANVAQDAATNGNTAASQFRITYDTSVITVTITSSAGTSGSSTNTSPIPVTVTFSESVTGFEANDVVIVGGTISSGSFSGSGSSYSFTITPSGEGTVIVAIAANVAQDAASNGNAAASQFNMTYDTTAPTISSTAPSNGVSVNNTAVSYTLSEAIVSGTITWTRTGGSADSGSPHDKALTGSELNAGMHTDIALTNSPTLVNGAIYTVKFDATDASGNGATTVSNMNVTYDVAAPSYSSTSSLQNTTVNTTEISYTLSETVASGTVTWTRTSGTTDPNSPHVQALTGTELNSGAHNSITLTNNPTLVDSTIYTVKFDATDAAGNVAMTVSNTSVTYDVVTQTPILANPVIGSSDNSTLVIDFTLPEGASSGTVKMTFTRMNGSVDVNSPHVITFVSEFETAAQHTATLDGSNLSNHLNVSSVNSDPSDALVDGAIYDVKIEYQDAAGNSAASVTNNNFTYDITSPTIFSTAPVTGVAVNSTIVSYTLSEAVVSGMITWTRTDGSADSGSPHEKELTGTELNSGVHTDITLTNDPTLVEGAIYVITFDVTDAAGNVATSVSVTDITYDLNTDFNTQTPTLTSPMTSSKDNSTVAIDFSLPEAASSGTVKMTFTRTNGSVDVNSPHVITFVSEFETAAQHTTTLDGSNLSNHLNVSSVNSDPNDTLVDGAIYDVKIEYQDAAGNSAASVTNNNFTYDITSPTISSTAPVTGTAVNSTIVSYTLSEAVVSGTITWTRTDGSADSGSPHTKELTGTELNSGVHTDITLTNDPTLVNGTIYTITFNVTDAAGNAATSVSITNVTYDFNTQTPTLVSPVASSVDNSTVAIDFSLPEAASSGTVKMTFTRTAGSVDTNSPHVITFVTGFETTAQHTTILDGNNLSDNNNIFSVTTQPNDVLVDGAIYDVKLEYQDALGNSAASVTNSGFLYDITSPSVMDISSSLSSPTLTSPVPITVTFSENVTEFDSSDVTIGNGIVTSGSFSGSGNTYSFTVTPTNDGTVTVDLVADKAQDTAGNNNTAATQFSITYDATAPTITISSPTTNSPTSSSPIPVTITFNENVTGFDSNEVSIGNGTLSSFESLSSTMYTFDATPSGNGIVMVDVAANTAVDLAGNSNEAAPQFSIIFKVAEIAVDPSSGLTVTEAGNTATFTVVLVSQPTADMLITLSSSDETEGTVLPNFLRFTNSNWDTSQTVTITGIDDDLDDGNIAFTIITGAVVSADPDYNELDPDDVTVTNMDNDGYEITILPSNGLITTETGGDTSFTLVLTMQPSADVTVSFNSSDSTEGFVSPLSATFTPENWNTAQRINVTGVNDDVADGNQTYSIIFGTVVSDDPGYNDIDVDNLAFTNLDDDSAGISVFPVSGLTTTEMGSDTSFTLVLTSQPLADVTIDLTCSDTTEGQITPSLVTFNSNNWNVTQTVNITGVNDGSSDGDQDYTIITSAVISDDPNYSGLDPDDISVTNIDTEPIIVVSTLDLQFGSVRRDSLVEQTIQVFNNGSGTLNITQIMTTGNIFEVSPLSLEVPPFTSNEIMVTFTPDELIQYFETLILVHNDSNLGNVEIALEGLGVKPTIVASQTEINFESVLINRDSTITFTVSNDGNDILTIDTIYTTNPLYIVSIANSDGEQSQSSGEGLTRFSNDESNKVVSPTIEEIKHNSLTNRNTKNLPASSSSKKFNSEDHGSLIASMEIRNSSKSDKKASFLSTNPKRFLEGTEIPFGQIPPGETIDLIVSFTPDASGESSATLTILSDDPDNQQLDMPLTGRGLTYPEASFNTLSFGIAVNQGEDIPFDLVISNDGDYPLDYEIAVEAEWNNVEWLSLSKQSGQVVDDIPDEVLVTILRTVNLSVGTYEGRLFITSNTGPNLTWITEIAIVTLSVLPSPEEIVKGDTTVPDGNSEPFELTDEDGTRLGIGFDFNSSQGGLVSALAIPSSAQTDSTTEYNDPDSMIDDPVFGNFYWEIFDNIPEDRGGEAFMVDITFDYSSQIGIQNPEQLRLVKRINYAGTGVPWEFIDMDNIKIDVDNKTITALNQTDFSQWTFASDRKYNSLEDSHAPVVVERFVSPESPEALQHITIHAIVTDESFIESVNLHYTKGGEINFHKVEMTLDEYGLYKGVIPASDVTLTGIAYTVEAVDMIGKTNQSDMVSISIDFPDNTLSTDIDNSAFSEGIPKNHWALISIPATLNDPDIAQIFGQELGGKPSKSSWKLYNWSGTSWTTPKQVTAGEGYWLYQKIKDDAIIYTGSGQTPNLTGATLTLKPGWNIVGSPYLFGVNIDLDESLFYGPLHYGMHNGEGWSDVETELKPWGGYIIYNKTHRQQTIDLQPLEAIESLQKMTSQRSPAGSIGSGMGWKLQIIAKGNTYTDVANYIGRMADAHEQLDYLDNPEPPYIDGFVSISMNRLEWGDHLPQFTSDIRSLEETDGIWDLNLRVKGEKGPISLSYQMSGEFPADHKIVLLDMINRKTYNLHGDGSLQSEDGDIIITEYSEKYPYSLKIIAGSPEFVSRSLQEVVDNLPKSFTLSQNYPNPFNPTTRIQFAVPKPAKVTLKVYNIVGQEVATLVQEWKEIGHYELIWDSRDSFGRPVSSSVYMYRIFTDEYSQTRKMMLLR